MFWRRKPQEPETQFRRRHLRYKTNIRHRSANPLFPKIERPKISLLKSGKLRAIGITGVVFVFLWFPFYSRTFSINDVYVEGNRELTIAQILTVVDKHLSTRAWFLLPQSNIFLLSKDRLQTALDEAYVFETLEIDKHFRRMSVSIIVKERIPGITFISQNTTYYTDLKGYVTHQVGEGEEIRPTFPVVRDHNNRETTVKEQVMTEEMVSALFEIHTSLPEQTQYTIDSYILPQVKCHETIEEEIPLILEVDEEEADALLISNSNTNSNTNSNANFSLLDTGETMTRKREVEVECKDYLSVAQDINIRLTDGPEVYFDTTRSIQGQLKKFQSTVEHELTSIEELEYIDLRFKNRVFYK